MPRDDLPAMRALREGLREAAREDHHARTSRRLLRLGLALAVTAGVLELVALLVF